MLIQSSHSDSDRVLDAYFTPSEATYSLLAIEKLPKHIWEPAAGNGAIVKILRINNYDVFPSDIFNYDEGYLKIDYLKAAKYSACEAIVTNPPFKLALEFIQKALAEVSYSAFLLRTNFLESIERLSFFRASPPSRVHISSRRLPMMHRHNYSGPIAPSNTCFAWFIWDYREQQTKSTQLFWFDWKEHTKNERNNTEIIQETIDSVEL